MHQKKNLLFARKRDDSSTNQSFLIFKVYIDNKRGTN